MSGSKTAQTAVAKKDNAKPATSTIPDGFVEYENKQFGFKFFYPKEWGNASVDTVLGFQNYTYDVEPKTAGPGVFIIKFSNSTVIVESDSLNKVQLPKGGTSLSYATGYCEISGKYYIEYLGIKDINGGYAPEGVKCGAEELTKAQAISSSRLFVPDFPLTSEGGYENITVGIFKISHKEFPGWFVIDREKANNEAIKQIVQSVKEL